MSNTIRFAVCATLMVILTGCQPNKSPVVGEHATPAVNGQEPPATGKPYRSPAVQEQAASARSQFAGNRAPDLSLPNQDNGMVRLGDLRGQWVVLYFYPADDTPGCTCQATEFTDLLGQFRAMNAVVLGASADPPAAHRAFIEHYKLGLTLLSDPDHKVMRQYGAWVESYMGSQPHSRVIRTTMIIDPRGIIRYHWPEMIPQGHAERVRQTLNQLQAQSINS